MKFILAFFAGHLRAKAFSLVSRLLMSLVASRLQPLAAKGGTRATGKTPAPGTIIDGEYRRIDRRLDRASRHHNDRW
ncbi:MAG: hypothetical protein IPO00_06705 [Betaproteobacteria bacterium]|nr:hypothetical protein [Betaproteobacteria bacterium]